MLQLKNYQEKALGILREFLEASRFEGAKVGYEKIQKQRFGECIFKPFQPLSGLENAPYCCLRLPTGGGKTLLSAHSIALAADAFIEKEFPLTLWLVPTNIIKIQTLETFQNPNHPNYQVLAKNFGGRFRVFDIANFRNIRPQDIAESACIVLATFASLRVDKTEGRKAYDHDENLEPHFVKIPSNFAGMEKSEDGQIKFSFANLLNWHRPLVIVDEAHNAKTDLSFEVLKRVNAACVIEYTATPAKNSNVILSIGAAELKAEEMIKLPILLNCHNSWAEAVIGAIQTRAKLENLANKDKDYIRPILLFQAEDVNQEVNVEALTKFLTESEGIDRNQIAIATGEQKELDSINLLNPCEIRYVITVQALKEGWDCPFAYVFCSLANTRSATAVEQLLGRVLRMPYARNREQKELNQAYAHVASKAWEHAATKLCDHLVSMGFEQQEAEELIVPQPILPFDEFKAEKNEVFQTFLTKEIDLSHLDLEERSQISQNKISDGSIELKLAENCSEALLSKVEGLIRDEKDKKEFCLRRKIFHKNQAQNQENQGFNENFEVFQLCLNFEGEIELAECGNEFEHHQFNLLEHSSILTKDEFALDEKGEQYLVDLAGEKLKIKVADGFEQLNFEGIRTEMDEKSLAIWLEKRLRAIDLTSEILLEFLRCTITKLLARDDLNLLKLSSGRFILEKILREKINFYRKDSQEKAFQTCMFESGFLVSNQPNFRLIFNRDNYRPNSLYEGRQQFKKHYFPLIGEMNGEEENCAFEIDSSPNVKFWIRNLERQPNSAFWLPTATDKFYPDFVTKLQDGRIAVVEFKGAQYAGSDDSKKKELIGKVWAEKSGNLFLMAWREFEGVSLRRQIEKFLKSSKTN